MARRHTVENLSPLVIPGSFQRLFLYDPHLERLPTVSVAPGFAAHPAIASPWKNGTQVNFNHSGYMAVSRVLWRDALTYVTVRPLHYLQNWGESLRVFLLPASEYALLELNRSTLGFWDGVVRRVVYPNGTGALLWLGTVLTVGGGTALTLSRSSSAADGVPFAALLAAFTVTWVTVIGNGFEFGENNRVRVAIDPLLDCAVCACLHRLGHAARGVVKNTA